MLNQTLEKHKQTIRCAALIALSLLVCLYTGYEFVVLWTASQISTAIVMLVAAACLLAVAYISALQFLSFRKKFRLEQVFVFSMAVLGVGYMLFFRPVAAPDEQAHYISAYRMSNYFLFHWSQLHTDGVIMRMADSVFYDTYCSSGIMSPADFAQLARDFALFTKDTALVSDNAWSTAIVNAPFGYLASALGIAVGRLLHLGAVPVFYCGRMCNIAAYILLVYRAIKRAPMWKGVFFTISMFPMTLHLVASYSYDGIVLALACLFTAEILHLIYGEPITRRQLICCAVLGVLLAPNKLVYTPLVFLVLLIPRKKLEQVCRRSNLVKAGMIGAAIVCLLAFQFIHVLKISGVSGGENLVAWADEPGYTVGWVLQNPLQTVILFLTTLVKQGEWYLDTLMGSSLGWFQLDVPAYFYLPFGLCFLIACMKKNDDGEPLPFLAKIWTLLLIIGSAALILASMLLSWTPLGLNYIAGVQGRYFLPLLPAAAMVLRNGSIRVNAGMERHMAAITGTLNVFILCCCTMELFGIV